MLKARYLPTEVELWLFDILVLVLVAAIDDELLVKDVDFPEFPELPPPEPEPEAFNFTELSMAVSNISAVCLLCCLTADDDDDCCLLLELLCCLLFSVLFPVLESDKEGSFGPEFKPDDEPLDLISLDILLVNWCFCALEKI